MKAAVILAATVSFLTVACNHSAGGTSTVESDGHNPSGTDAYGWCHSPALRSTDSVNIGLDYQPKLTVQTSPGDGLDTTTATNAWLNVSKYGFSGSEQVSVVVLTLEQGSKSAAYGGVAALANQQTVALTWNASAQKFTAQIPQDLFLGSYVPGDDETTQAIYQFAVVIDGTWESDPVSGGHNFQFMPFSQTQGACTGSYFSAAEY